MSLESLRAWLDSLGRPKLAPYQNYLPEIAVKIMDQQYQVKIGDTLVPVAVVSLVGLPVPSLTRNGVTFANIPAATFAFDVPVLGSGKLLYCCWNCFAAVDAQYLVPQIDIEDVGCFPFFLTMLELFTYCIGVNSPQVALGLWDTIGNNYSVVCVLPLNFRNRIELGYYNSDLLGVHSGNINYVLEMPGV